MADLLGQIRRLNGLSDRAQAEPFAGGAGASLGLLYREEAPEVHINDADHSIRDFWWAIINRPDEFADMLSATRLSMAEWRRQRDTYRDRRRMPRLRRGFATFYLNRCNRSGIIMNGGPIGGVKQTGEWGLDARFNKEELKTRCRKVYEYRERIRVTGLDGLEFLKASDPATTFYFIDPPYFAKGKTLYLNRLDAAYHEALGAYLKTIHSSSWVLTYDDCPEIRQIYEGWATVRPFSLRYAASERRAGRELMIVPNWMRLPVSQTSDAIHW